MSEIYNFTNDWSFWDLSDGNWSEADTFLLFTDVAASGGCSADDDALIEGEKYKLSIRFESHTEVEGYVLTCKLKDSLTFLAMSFDGITDDEIYTEEITAGSGANDITITDTNSQAGNTAELDLVKVETIAAGKATAPSPADDAVNVSAKPTLSWTNGDNVAKTVLFIRKKGGDWVQKQNTGSAETSYTPPSHLDYGQGYDWIVNSYNGHDESIGGDIWSFTVVRCPRTFHQQSNNTGVIFRQP